VAPPTPVSAPPEAPPEPAAGAGVSELQPESEKAVRAKAPVKIWVRQVFIVVLLVVLLNGASA
jgi:hypothetical protein